MARRAAPATERPGRRSSSPRHRIPVRRSSPRHRIPVRRNQRPHSPRSRSRHRHRSSVHRRLWCVAKHISSRAVHRWVRRHPARRLPVSRSTVTPLRPGKPRRSSNPSRPPDGWRRSRPRVGRDVTPRASSSRSRVGRQEAVARRRACCAAASILLRAGPRSARPVPRSLRAGRTRGVLAARRVAAAVAVRPRVRGAPGAVAREAVAGVPGAAARPRGCGSVVASSR